MSLLEQRRAALGDGHLEVANTMQNLAVMLMLAGAPGEALKVLEQVRASYVASLPPEHYRLAFPLLTQSFILLRQGEPALAELAARPALRILQGALPATHYAVGIAGCLLGEPSSRWGGVKRLLHAWRRPCRSPTPDSQLCFPTSRIAGRRTPPRLASDSASRSYSCRDLPSMMSPCLRPPPPATITRPSISGASPRLRATRCPAPGLLRPRAPARCRRRAQRAARADPRSGCHEALPALFLDFVRDRRTESLAARPRPASRGSSRRGRAAPLEPVEQGWKSSSVSPGKPTMKVLRRVRSGQISRQRRMRSSVFSACAGRASA
jgi:hypothetical protein